MPEEENASGVMVRVSAPAFDDVEQNVLDDEEHVEP